MPRKVWNEVIFPTLKRFYRYGLGIDKLFHSTHYNGCNYLSVLRLNLIHVSKGGYSKQLSVIGLILWKQCYTHCCSKVKVKVTNYNIPAPAFKEQQWKKHISFWRFLAVFNNIIHPLFHSFPKLGSYVIFKLRVNKEIPVVSCFVRASMSWLLSNAGIYKIYRALHNHGMGDFVITWKNMHGHLDGLALETANALAISGVLH